MFQFWSCSYITMYNIAAKIDVLYKHSLIFCDHNLDAFL